MPFNVRNHLIRVQGGREYLPVAYRLVWFREEHPDWSILTQPLSLDLERGIAVFQAEVRDADNRVLARGTKAETAKGFGDYIEKAETGAVGCALGMLGYARCRSGIRRGGTTGGHALAAFRTTLGGTCVARAGSARQPRSPGTAGQGNASVSVSASSREQPGHSSRGSSMMEPHNGHRWQSSDSSQSPSRVSVITALLMFQGSDSCGSKDISLRKPSA